MEQNISIYISNNLKTLNRERKASVFYNGLLDLIKELKQAIWFNEYLKKIKNKKKVVEVTLRREHKKSSEEFDAKLGKDEFKKLFSLQMKSDINQPFDAWSILSEFEYIVKNRVKPWRKGREQTAWDFNLLKQEYQKLIDKKESRDNIFVRNIERYKRAVTVVTRDFLKYLEERENIFEFIGVKYNKKTEMLSFKKIIKRVPIDDQRIKFFQIMANNNDKVGYMEICKFCLPKVTLDKYEYCDEDVDYSAPAKTIKLNFCNLLIESLGCKKETINDNLKSSKKHGYVFVRK